MEWEIRKVTELNKKELLVLRVAEDQRHFIETVEECLADAEQWKEFRPVGLYVDGIAVGFAMYGYLGDGKGGGNLWLTGCLLTKNTKARDSEADSWCCSCNEC